MFLKRISDTFDEEKEKVINKFLDKKKTLSQAEKLAQNPIEYDTFFISKKHIGVILKVQNITLAKNLIRQ